MLFLSAVNTKALELLRSLQDLNVLKDFYLVGGTALALKFGHRNSVDLDFFTRQEFETNFLVEALKEKFSLLTLSQAKNSITLDIQSIKTDFIRHNYPLLNPINIEDNIKMASVEDIAAMKLNCTMNRGSKKDFFDIYELLNHFTLRELLLFYAKKYEFNSQIILLKSLVYFDDAETEPDPLSLNPLTWDNVKDKIAEEVRTFTNSTV